MGSIDIEDAAKTLSQIPKVLEALGELIDEHEVLVRIEDEYETEKKLLEENMFKTVIIRQSTFFESFLTSLLKMDIESRIERSLSRSETHFLTQGLNPKGKVYLADWLGQIDESEREALLELMSIRGTIAHEAWIELESQDNENLERIAKRIHNQIGDLLDSDILI